MRIFTLFRKFFSCMAVLAFAESTNGWFRRWRLYPVGSRVAVQAPSPLRPILNTKGHFSKLKTQEGARCAIAFQYREPFRESAPAMANVIYYELMAQLWAMPEYIGCIAVSYRRIVTRVRVIITRRSWMEQKLSRTAFARCHYTFQRSHRSPNGPTSSEILSRS